MKKPYLIATFALAAFFMSAVGFLVCRSFSSPVNLATLHRLQPGATPADVESLFGAPQDKHDLYGDHRWCYYKTNQSRIVYVIFDKDMRYKGYELDD